MKKEEALEWIHGRLKFGSRPGLIRIERLLELLGNPEKDLKIVHIAGTNGKGSTTAFLRSILKEHGLKVGSFTSPYIESFNERIAINGENISDDALIQLVEKIKPLVSEMDKDETLKGITEFEILTAMGLLHFYEEKVDVAVVEVGLGGLYDSTNVVSPILTGITTIGLDHQDILGESIAAITEQKAGILKDGVPCVCGKISKESIYLIQKIAQEKNAQLFKFNEEYNVVDAKEEGVWEENFHYTFLNQLEIKGLSIHLLGKHQIENAGMAITLALLTLKECSVGANEKAIRIGCKKAFWAARMERISEKPLIVLDGAHNPHAIERLIETIKTEFYGKKIHVLFSALQTKDYTEMIEELQKVEGVKVTVTTFDYPKAIELTGLEEQGIDVASNWQFAFAEIIEKMNDEDLFLVTGSLYFISQVRELYLLND